MSGIIAVSRSSARRERQARVRDGRRVAAARALGVGVLTLAAVGLAAGWAAALTGTGQRMDLGPVALDSRAVAIALLAAETYALAVFALFVVAAWRARGWQEPVADLGEDRVDVLIVATGAPLDRVLAGVGAALRLRGVRGVAVADEGGDADRARAVEEAGARSFCGDRGAVDAAIAATEGEFLLVLEAGRVPDAGLIESTLGAFDDPRIGFVRLQRRPRGLPSLLAAVRARGLAGWEALPFRGVGTIVRREALLQLGIARYAAEVEQSVRRRLARADAVLMRARDTDTGREPLLSAALDTLGGLLEDARVALRRGEPVALVTFALQDRVSALSRDMVAIQLHESVVDVAAMTEADLVGLSAETVPAFDFGNAIGELADGDSSPLAALAEVHELVRSIDIDLGGAAQPTLPLGTTDATADLRTSLALHAANWRGTVATARVPFVAGVRVRRGGLPLPTIGVALRAFARPGLTAAQRVLYAGMLRWPLSLAAAGVLLAGGASVVAADAAPVVPAIAALAALVWLAVDTASLRVLVGAPRRTSRAVSRGI